MVSSPSSISLPRTGTDPPPPSRAQQPSRRSPRAQTRSPTARTRSRPTRSAGSRTSARSASRSASSARSRRAAHASSRASPRARWCAGSSRRCRLRVLLGCWFERVERWFHVVCGFVSASVWRLVEMVEVVMLVQEYRVQSYPRSPPSLLLFYPSGR